LMSTRVSGCASRSFIIGMRLCPPARIRASGPYLASRLSAATADPASPAELARRRAALAYIPFAGTAR